MAIAQGADGVEVDVVPSRDGRLVLRHDRLLGRTTDIARHRHRDSGVDELDWPELGGLRARERWPELRPASARFDGREPLLTLPDAVRIAEETGVLLVVEIKDATAFATRGHDPVPLVARDLARMSARVVLESFEKAPLDALRHLGLPSMHLRDEHGRAAGGRPGGPDPAAEPEDPVALDRFSGVSLPVPLVTAARVDELHAAGLQVWVFTLRAENAFLPGRHRRGADPAARGDWRAAWSAVLESGVDGAFTDHPDLLLDLLRERRRSA